MTNEEIAEFFTGTEVHIRGNGALREPQRDGYEAVRTHFASSNDPCYVQLPVGCGKTGLMGIVPFGVAKGRVLIIAPNLIVKRTIYDELNISDPNCFFAKRGVFTPANGPFISELKGGANIHDCDDAHMVLANIQQFAGEDNRWYEEFTPDYFDMILVDEGHHNVADTWLRLFQYLDRAKVASFTATPIRSDGRPVIGRRVYSFTYTRSMLLGYISPVDAVYVKPQEITFTARGEQRTLSLAEVLQMRDELWFSRGIALSEECNRHIVQASMKQLAEVRRHGSPRMVIACTCSIRHAAQVAQLYREYGLSAEILHSDLKPKDRERVESVLRLGSTDVVAQVQMLGEGYDLRTLSVAAIFRPFRTLSPYIQFVGRILRLADPEVAYSPGNKVYVVSHVGLNDERWWSDFANFDREDQQFFASYLAGADEREVEGDDHTPRLTLRPFMRVLNETIAEYAHRAYLTDIDETMVQEFIETIKQKGFDPLEFGLSEEIIRRRLSAAVEAQRTATPYEPVAQPQRIREARRMRLVQEARAIADTVINRLGLSHGGRDLVRLFPGRGPSNAAIIIALAQGAQNKAMDIAAGQRDEATKEQFETAIQASADIVDQLTKLMSDRIGEGNA